MRISVYMNVFVVLICNREWYILLDSGTMNYPSEGRSLPKNQSIHVWNRLSVFKKGTYTKSVDQDETLKNTLFGKIKTLLVMVDMTMQSFGDNSSKVPLRECRTKAH